MRFPNFTDTGVLNAEDYGQELQSQMTLQAAYTQARRSAGVLEGLTVLISDDYTSVEIAPGLALDPLGRTLQIDSTVILNLQSTTTSSVFVALSLEETPQAWTAYEGASGHTRIQEQTQVLIAAQLDELSEAAVVLAQIMIGPDRLLTSVDTTSRQLSQAHVSTLSFPRPLASAEQSPSIQWDSEKKAVTVSAERTDVFGDLHIIGRMAVGPATTINSRLTVKMSAEQSGQGTVSNAQNTWTMDTPDAVASLSVGDTLVVKNAPDQKDGFRTQITRVYPEGVFETETAPVGNVSDKAYGYQRNTLMRVIDDRGTTAFLVTSQGQIGIGTSTPEADLDLRDGDINLGGDCSLIFSQSGFIQGGPSSASPAVGLDDNDAPLVLRSPGDVVLALSGPQTTIPPALIVQANGNVGLSVAAPEYKLSVNGQIRASQGLIFPDNTRQSEGVIPIPIGTVIDWWRPEGAAEFDMEGFQVCNGATITDPDSPLKGSNTPDLSNRMVRGVTNFKEIGDTGGSLTHTHTYTEAEHTHSIAHQHWVSGATTGTSGSAGDAIAGSSVCHHEHTHNFNLLTSQPTPAESESAGPFQSTTVEGSSLPRHMIVLKVMRIK